MRVYRRQLCACLSLLLLLLTLLIFLLLLLLLLMALLIFLLLLLLLPRLACPVERPGSFPTRGRAQKLQEE